MPLAGGAVVLRLAAAAVVFNDRPFDGIVEVSPKLLFFPVSVGDQRSPCTQGLHLREDTLLTYQNQDVAKKVFFKNFVEKPSLAIEFFSRKPGSGW